jgi:hypothetical protein
MNLQYTKLLIAERSPKWVLPRRDVVSDDPDVDVTEGIVGDLTTLQSEFAQLSELDEMEQNYTRKLIDSLKILQSEVDVALPLRTENLGPAYSNSKESYLASDCVVIIFDTEDNKRSIPLIQFESKYVLSIVKEATPALAKIISERRKDVGSRVDLLERILKEVKKAGNIAKSTNERAVPQSAEDDLVQNSITSE